MYAVQKDEQKGDSTRKSSTCSREGDVELVEGDVPYQWLRSIWFAVSYFWSYTDGVFLTFNQRGRGDAYRPGGRVR